MLAGAWGARAGELLARAAEHRGTGSLQRVGGLAMLDPPDTVAGSWCCWLFGEPEDRGELAARFGLGTDGDLPTAFGRALTELGERACELLQGRFVVVALDREQNRCLVTRDQLGAQPLIYTRVERRNSVRRARVRVARSAPPQPEPRSTGAAAVGRQRPHPAGAHSLRVHPAPPHRPSPDPRRGTCGSRALVATPLRRTRNGNRDDAHRTPTGGGLRRGRARARAARSVQR